MQWASTFCVSSDLPLPCFWCIFVYSTLHGEHYTWVLTLSGSCAMYAYNPAQLYGSAGCSRSGVGWYRGKKHQTRNSSSLWKTEFKSLCCISAEVSLLTSLCNQYYANKASLDSWWEQQLFIPLWRKNQTLLQQSSYPFAHILQRSSDAVNSQEHSKEQGTREEQELPIKKSWLNFWIELYDMTLYGNKGLEFENLDVATILKTVKICKWQIQMNQHEREQYEVLTDSYL